MADLFNVPMISAKYTLRSSEEEVEVIAFGLEEQGARKDNDWVTYIDSEGNEHIKEHLNIQLDFKVSDTFSDSFKRLLEMPKWKEPSTENIRLYDTAKELVVKRGSSVEEAVTTAKRLVEQVKEESEYDN